MTVPPKVEARCNSLDLLIAHDENTRLALLLLYVRRARLVHQTPEETAREVIAALHGQPPFDVPR